MNTRTKRLAAVLAGMVLLPFVCCCAQLIRSTPQCLEAPYSAPPAQLDALDLVGTWRTNYALSVDTLVLRRDGTFKQIYEDRLHPRHRYETPWNQWNVHRFPDGRVRATLEGARYYAAGTRVAEDGGRFGGEMRFYDPIAHEFLDTERELVLNVRVDSSGELLLLHMWSTGDDGYPVFLCGWTFFRRVDLP